MKNELTSSLFDQENPILKDITSRFSYFFYLNNINQRFDLDLEDYHFDDEDELSKDEMEEIEAFSNLTKSSRVIRIVNSVFDKVAHLTSLHGTSLFVDTNALKGITTPSYISYDKKNDFSHQTLGNVHTNKMYSFLAKVSEDSYLYRFFDTFQVMFYLEQETNRVQGGFSLNKFDQKNKNFNETVNDFYLNNLINSFIKDQLYPYDLETFLDIDLKAIQKDNMVLQIEDLTVNSPNFQLLKSNWERLLNTKYLKYVENISTQEQNYLLNTLFYSVLSSWLIMILVVEELDEYFSNGNEAQIESLNGHKHELKIAHNTTFEEASDFISLVNYLRKTKITDFKAKKFDNYSFSEPHLIYDVYSQKELFLVNFDYLLSHPMLVSFLLIILFKEDYTITDINSNYLNLFQFKNLISTDISRGFSKNKIEKWKETVCSRNFYYVSFIKDGDVVILHNPKDVDEKRRSALEQIPNYYMWSLVFIVSKELERDDLNYHVNYLSTSNQKNKVVYFRQILRDIEDIRFNWDDDFFGIKQIKKIVFNMDKQVGLMSSLNGLQKQVKDEDEIFKRQSERTSIIISFIVALLIGYVDFLACVFSILPCSWLTISWGWILGTIGFTTITTSINLAILLWTVIYLGRLRYFYKLIDARDRRIRFEGSNSPKFVAKN